MSLILIKLLECSGSGVEKRVYRISGFEAGVEEDRYILRNEKKTDFYLHLKARVCHVLLVNDGLKISSRMTFDRPSVGRAFS